MKSLTVGQIFIFICLLAISGTATSAFYYHKRGYLIDYHRGERLYQEKQFASAIPLLEKAIADGVNTRAAYFHLADSLTAEEEFDRAIQVYQKYLEQNPNDKPAQLRLARVLSYQGKQETSSQFYEEVLKKQTQEAK